MRNAWYCLDCGYRGPKHRGPNPFILALLALPPARLIWLMVADLPHAPAFGFLSLLEFDLVYLLFWLSLPLAYLWVTARPRCAKCRHRRIIPADSPNAQIAEGQPT
jgi:hypothetical protein